MGVRRRGVISQAKVETGLEIDCEAVKFAYGPCAYGPCTSEAVPGRQSCHSRQRICLSVSTAWA